MQQEQGQRMLDILDGMVAEENMKGGLGYFKKDDHESILLYRNIGTNEMMNLMELLTLRVAKQQKTNPRHVLGVLIDGIEERLNSQEHALRS